MTKLQARLALARKRYIISIFVFDFNRAVKNDFYLRFTKDLIKDSNMDMYKQLSYEDYLMDMIKTTFQNNKEIPIKALQNGCAHRQKNIACGLGLLPYASSQYIANTMPPYTPANIVNTSSRCCYLNPLHR